MKKKWSATQLVTAGSLGVLSVVLTLPATSIIAFTGIPLLGGVVNIFFDRTLDSLTLFLIPRFGSVTFKRTVLGIVALPTLLLGPAGFLPKVLISATSGLITDVIFYFVKKRNKKYASIFSNSVSAAMFGSLFVFVARVFQVPGVEETVRVFLSPLLIIGAALGGAISGYLGWIIYKKIENTAPTKRIQK